MRSPGTAARSSRMWSTSPTIWSRRRCARATLAVPVVAGARRGRTESAGHRAGAARPPALRASAGAHRRAWFRPLHPQSGSDRCRLPLPRPSARRRRRVADGPRLFQSPRVTGRLSGRRGSRCGGCGGSERTSFDRPNGRAGGGIPTSRRGRRVWCSPPSGRRSSPLPARPRCRARRTARRHCAKRSGRDRPAAVLSPGARAVGNAESVVVGLSGGGWSLPYGTAWPCPRGPRTPIRPPSAGGSPRLVFDESHATYSCASSQLTSITGCRPRRRRPTARSVTSSPRRPRRTARRSSSGAALRLHGVLPPRPAIPSCSCRPVPSPSPDTRGSRGTRCPARRRRPRARGYRNPPAAGRQPEGRLRSRSGAGGEARCISHLPVLQGAAEAEPIAGVAAPGHVPAEGLELQAVQAGSRPSRPRCPAATTTGLRHLMVRRGRRAPPPHQQHAPAAGEPQADPACVKRRRRRRPAVLPARPDGQERVLRPRFQAGFHQHARATRGADGHRSVRRMPDG